MSSQTVSSDQTRPKLRYGAKALLSTTERVLIIKERHADGSPFWTLPGGGTEPGESLRETLHRELTEELRCRATVIGPVTSFCYAHSGCSGRMSQYTVFDCRLRSSAIPNVVEGIYESRWVRADQIPTTTLPQVRQLIESRVQS